MTTPTDPVQRPPPGTRRSRCRSAIAPALEKADAAAPAAVQSHRQVQPLRQIRDDGRLVHTSRRYPAQSSMTPLPVKSP